MVHEVCKQCLYPYESTDHDKEKKKKNIDEYISHIMYFIVFIVNMEVRKINWSTSNIRHNTHYLFIKVICIRRKLIKIKFFRDSPALNCLEQTLRIKVEIIALHANLTMEKKSSRSRKLRPTESQYSISNSALHSSRNMSKWLLKSNAKSRSRWACRWLYIYVFLMDTEFLSLYVQQIHIIWSNRLLSRYANGFSIWNFSGRSWAK